MQSLIIAFSMFSRFPMPRADWREENMRYVFCWFPLVGLVIGAVMAAAFALLEGLGAGSLVRAAVMTALPILLTGGIHLDGFMDTADARSSMGNRERKLEILKDSHIGAFAVIHLAVYMVLTLGAWGAVSDLKAAAIVCSGCILSRSLSGLAAVTLPGAREKGMLASFTKPSQKKTVRLVLVVWAIAAVLLMAYMEPLTALAAACGAMLALWHYRRVAINEFGGTTGDLAGWFLQECELFILLAAAAVCMLIPA